MLNVKQCILPFELLKLRNKAMQNSEKVFLNHEMQYLFVSMLWLKEKFWTNCRNHINPVTCRKVMCTHKSSLAEFLFSVVFFNVISFSNFNSSNMHYVFKASEYVVTYTENKMK